MTFEQWADQMKKGLFLQTDEKPNSLNQIDDRFDWDMEEEESPESLFEHN